MCYMYVLDVYAHTARHIHWQSTWSKYADPGAPEGAHTIPVAYAKHLLSNSRVERFYRPWMYARSHVC